MLHPTRVARAFSGNRKRRIYELLRSLLRLKAPVLENDFAVIAKWRQFFCRQLLSLIPPDMNLTGAHVCEVDTGNCLASAAASLGLGAARVEIHTPAVSWKQGETLVRSQREGASLDFQSYPDWLYGEMDPRYHRAAQRGGREYRWTQERAGFKTIEIGPLRLPELAFVKPFFSVCGPPSRCIRWTHFPFLSLPCRWNGFELLSA